MKRVAFVKSEKKFEDRVAILPNHLEMLNYSSNIYIESGYASHLGISDEEYIKKGANIVKRREDLLEMEVIVDPKIGDAKNINKIKKGSTIFGYFHAVQNRTLTDILVKNKYTCYAWEDLNDNGTHLFNYNNYLAGYASVVHSSTLWKRRFLDTKVAIVGKGNTAKGALEAMQNLGASVEIFDRASEEKFIKSKHDFDVIIIAVLWDMQRNDYLLEDKDLSLLKKGSLIIDISCDIDGAIQFSQPKDMDDCMNIIEGIYLYSLSNSPSVYAYEASDHFGNVVSKFLNNLMCNLDDEILSRAKIIEDGAILDDKIKSYQSR